MAWRDIPNYEGVYRINEQGEILNVRRNRIVKHGRTINLFHQRRYRCFTIAHLVWITFKGDIPEGCKVYTLDGNPLHYWLDNLVVRDTNEWLREQIAQGRLAIKGEASPVAKITEAQAKEIIARASTGESCKAIAKNMGITYAIVSNIVHLDSWQHLPRPVNFQRLREANKNTRKFTAQDKRAIKTMLAQGATYREIMNAFPIDISQLSRVANGKMWKGITPS